MNPEFTRLAAELEVYRRGRLHYTRCLCRDTEVLISGQPEEVVRQALLLHLLRRSGLCPGTIELRAEFNDLDVAVLKPPVDERFRPVPRPLVIIEVKRLEAALNNHEGQLFNYLAQTGTGTGVLCNGRELIAYRSDGHGGWASGALTSLGQLDEVLREAAAGTDPHLDQFRRAAAGCVTSFLSLADTFGRYTLHRVQFALKGVTDPITGCCFRVQDGRVFYDLYGSYSRRQKLSFDPREFDRLLSVVY